MLSNNLLALLEICADEEVTEPATETNSEETVETTEQDTTQGQPEGTPEEQFFEIDGERLTPQQIKEYKQGYLRQSDYTKKTQELASQRNQYKEALDLYDYFKANPHLAEKLAELEETEQAPKLNISNPAIEKLQIEVKTMQIEKEIAELSKDPYFNELEVLDIATKEGKSVKEAFDIWKGKNFDKILQSEKAKISTSLTDEIKKNNSATKTLINPNDNTDVSFGLSDIEMKMADKLGMSYEDYAKWR